MTAERFQLSIEELAYAVGVLGGDEAASGYLLTLLGERPQREIQGRLLAAAHGLVARDLLDFDETAGIKGLSPELEAAVTPLLNHRYALRCSNVADGHEAVLSVYFSDAGIAAQELYRSVAAKLELLPDVETAVERITVFFGLAESRYTDAALGTVDADLMEQARYARDGEQRKGYAAQFAAGGLPVDAAHTLAHDLADHAQRGSVLRISIANDAPTADEGFLVLRAPARAWLFEISPDNEKTLHVLPGHAGALRRALTTLMHA